MDEKEKKRKERIAITISYGVATGIAFVVLLVLSLMAHNWGVGLFLAVLTFFLISGPVIVREKYRAPAERLGKYKGTLRPGFFWGLRWLLLPGIVDKIVEKIFIKQKGTPFYTEPIKIDFRDGSAVPKKAMLYTEINNPDTPYLTEQEEKVPPEEREAKGIVPRTGVYRAAYHIANRDEEVVNRVENAVRSYLNRLMLEQGIEMARGGYNLLDAGRMPRKELNGLQGALNNWGVRLVAVTIGDFDLEEDLVKARGERHKKQKEREAASEVSERRAEEDMGALIWMFAKATGRTREKVETEILNNQKLKERFIGISENLTTRRMGIDGGAFFEAMSPGGTTIEGLLTLAERLFGKGVNPQDKDKKAKTKGKVNAFGKDWEVEKE